MMRTLLTACLAGLLGSACSSDPTGHEEPGQLVLASITSGNSGSCGLKAGNGVLICWGGAGAGILPPSTTGPCNNTGLVCVTRAVEVPTAHTFRQVSTTGLFGHVCGVTTQGGLYCWGEMLVTADFIVPIATTPQVFLASQPVAAVATGDTHDCAVTNGGAAFCWGDNDFNVRGTGGPVSHSFDFIPNPVSGGFTFTAITAGRTHTCGLEASGEALCWGQVEAVGLIAASPDTGCGLATECVATPVRVAQNRHYKALSAGFQVTCGITTLDELYCWGPGEANPGALIEPAKVDLPSAVTQVSVGWGIACAIVTGGDAWCWGRNTYGQLGNGSAADLVLPPAKVVDGHSFSAISAGSAHTCALGLEGRTWCWGSNQYGGLGTGDVMDHVKPVKVLAPAPAILE